tara:strand:- start:1550 stop:2158 length:609 start_codon:yes stop_codon:yes gene_type:complete
MAVQKSKYIKRLILSSDDKEIMEVANRYGCDTPFVRNEKLSEDVDTALVSYDALKKCELIYKEKYDAVMTLEPTSPFRKTDTIDKCIELMESNNSIDSVVTVSNVEGNRPEWMVKIDSNNKATPYATPFSFNGKPIIRLCARQDFPPLYALNGVVFLTKKELLKDKLLVGQNFSVVETSDFEAIDIDTEIDLKFAHKLALEN